MQRHAPLAEIPPQAKGAAIALGNFDGVHRGHQAVIASANAAAAARNVALGAAVFTPHPRRLFFPDTPPFRLQTPDQRARALAATGVAHLFGIEFDRPLTQLTDRAFAERVLVGRLGVSHVSVGEDFRFGRERMGDIESLKALGEDLGFTVEGVAPVGDETGVRISSTAIRTALTQGDVAEAQRLLGRPWAIEGVVVRGFARGREIGFPTLNVELGDYQRPRLGIYAVRVDAGDGGLRPGVASIGVNPTTGALPAPLLEAHIFDFNQDLYGRTIEAQLIAFLRPEAKFDSMQAMARQIEADAQQARALLA